MWSWSSGIVNEFRQIVVYVSRRVHCASVLLQSVLCILFYDSKPTFDFWLFVAISFVFSIRLLWRTLISFRSVSVISFRSYRMDCDLRLCVCIRDVRKTLDIMFVYLHWIIIISFKFDNNAFVCNICYIGLLKY